MTERGNTCQRIKNNDMMVYCSFAEKSQDEVQKSLQETTRLSVMNVSS